MSLDLISTVLVGQSSWLQSPEFMTILKLIVAFPLPIFLGIWLAKLLRMRDFGWKLATIFCTLCIGGVFLTSFPLRLGVDLKGGVILVYEIDRDALKIDESTVISPTSIDWGHLLQRLNDRINPSGTKEIVVRRYGDWQVEVIIPDVDTSEVERIKKLISTAGSLEFRIVANSTQHDATIQAAKAQAQDSAKKRSKYVLDQDGNRIGYWARVGREVNEVKGGIRPLKVHVANYTIRNSATGDLLELQNVSLDQEYGLERWLKEQGISDIDVLMYTGDEYGVSGENLGMVSRGNDELANPCVHFNMKASGAGLMGGLTGDNLPDEQRGFYSLLGIMLDGSLLSAPRVMSTITDSGRITGQFTQEEVDFLVGILQAGSLPAALKKAPIAQNTIGAIVGDETIRRGKLAAGLALASTFVFMVIWYRFAGFVACLALAANLLLTLAVMKFPLRAPLTLPGLAGLVLGVGMAVDANVLIYERIREELERGSALRMAIRNGFDRAMVTIVDSNLTTLITALVMYVIGTDQIRGFAITLSLGIMISMFTAVFCARVVFDIFERKRWISTLRMTKLFDVTHIDFLGKKHIAIGLSILFIVVGLVATAARGKQIFDIDFLGGTSVTMVLKESADERGIRSKLDEQFAGMRIDGSAVQYSVNRVDVEGLQERTVWKIDSSLQEVEELEKILQELFPVAVHSVTVSQLTEERSPLSPATPQAPEKTEPAKPASKTAEPKQPTTQPAPVEAPKEKPAETKPAETKPAEAKPAEAKPAEAKPAETKPAEAKPAEAKPAETKPAETKPAEAKPAEAKPAEAKPAQAKPAQAKPAEAKPAETKPAETKPAEAKPAEAKPAADGSARTDLPPATMLAWAGGDEQLLALADAEKQSDEAAPTAAPQSGKQPAGEATEAQPQQKAVAGDAKPAKEAAKDGPEKTAPRDAAEAASPAKPAENVRTSATLTFDYKMNGRTVQHEVVEAAGVVNVLLNEEEDITITLNGKDLADNPDWTIDDSVGYKEWIVTLDTHRATAEQIFRQMEKTMRQAPVWSSSSKIGGKVAGDTRNLAIVALITSWVGIVIYIWIRFQKVAFGLAAVVALIHDVLISLAAVAVSLYLASVLGFMAVEEFKISLTVVVAFLTIIGYSVNDTIVVFDRIREVRGKSPTLTQAMVNRSVNETLSRTLLTGLCTIVNAVILYAIGGEGVHAFAYVLFVGFVSGTYSSIYIASPFVLWLYGGKPAARTTNS